MKQTEYRSILGRLPIKNPTPADMAMLCPHLTAEEAVQAFTTGSGYVAVPSLRIRHGFQIVSHQREWVEEIRGWGVVNGQDTRIVIGSKNHPAQLNWSCAGRTLASYADGMSHGDVFAPYTHADRAMKFAEDHWGDELILDDWVCVVEIFVQDPTDLVTDRYHTDYPRTKAVLYIALSRDLGKIMNDHSKPESDLFDEAIAQMTLDRFVWHEIKGGRGGYTEFNCAHCGAGLELSGCSGCGHRFRDDQYRCGWHTPLSRKMVAFLHDHGHLFKVDPEIARTKEREGWEARAREEKE